MPNLLDEIADSLAWDQEVYGTYYHKELEKPITASESIPSTKEHEATTKGEVILDKNSESIAGQENSAIEWELNDAISIADLHQHFYEYFGINPSQNVTAKFIYSGKLTAEIALLFNNCIYNKSGELRRPEAFSLLTKMMAAISQPIDELFISSISRLPKENLDQSLLNKEVDFTLKQLEMLSPKLVLCFNPKVLVLLSVVKANEEPKRGLHQLPNGLKIFYTHSPSLLLEKPEFKREAWEDLQAFQKILASL